MMLLAFGFLLLGLLQSFAAPDFQVIALSEMKMMLNDSRDVLKEWKDNQVSPCYFPSVICQDDKVTGITLSSSGLTGVLSPSIAKLTTLQQLLLDDNSITGGIPQELGNLSSLMTLRLGRNNLNGSIPESFGRLSSLQNLDLSQNLLSGNIPSSLSNLPSLKDINLEHNNLRGEIPEQLLQVSRYNYTGNHLNCGQHLISCEGGTTKTGGSRNPTLKVVLGSIGGAVTLLATVVLFLLWWQRMRNRPEIYIDVPGQNDHSLEFGQIKRFSWRELQIATNNFSEQSVLGKGGFSKVYKGVLPGPDSRKVAVKRLFEVERPEGEMAFLRDVELISIAVHKNILRLIGFCTTPTERLLVYPFMENLSVASRLRDIKLNEPALDWPTRMTIALGAARGFEYLHEHCNPKIIHHDVKAANILLDGNFEAVVGDFGLAKMISMDIGRNTVTTRVHGTMGHIAPEYLKTGRPSVKTDIFGYGVMLLEIVTGECAIFPDYLEGAGEVMLIDQVKLLMQERRLEDIVDRNLDCAYDLEELEKIIQIALLCTHMDLDHRPAMSEVVQMLEGDVPADPWEEWQLAELTRRQQYEMRQQHSTNFSGKGGRKHHTVSTQVEPGKIGLWGTNTGTLHNIEGVSDCLKSVTICSGEVINSLALELLEKVTGGFSEENEIGSGGYGKVYKGILNGKEIAVKKLHGHLVLDDEIFKNESENLMRVRHQNIVELVGYCHEIRHKCVEHNGRTVWAEMVDRVLCFEYLQKGSLDKHLYEEHRGLDWCTRYKIIKGICEGLNYLHGLEKPILHLDLKPANILLDENMVPKIADFGLSRLFGGTHTHITKNPVGTTMYMPPECVNGGIITKKNDVFSLGVIIIQIMTGREGYSKYWEMSSSEYRVQQFIELVHQNWKVRVEATSMHTSAGEDCKQVKRCIEIALNCVELERQKRPTIGDIIHKLRETETMTHEVPMPFS